MKKLIKVVAFIAVVSSLTFTACKKEPAAEAPDTTTVTTEVIIDNSSDVDTTAVITDATVDTTVEE